MLDTLPDTRSDDAGPQPAPVSSRPRSTWEPDGTRHKIICILGSHPATVMQAPFQDDSAYIYACSPHNVEHRTLPRVDCWCELHDPIEDPTRAFAYLKAVSEMPVVMMRDKRALSSGAFKGARPYPEEKLKGTSTFQKVTLPNPDGTAEVRKVEIPHMDGMFAPYMFTSSIAYMLAKAIDDCEREGIKQIGIWGVLQRSDTEYVYQRPGIQYFLHEAMRRGIKVVANRESCLFDMPTWKW
jgi:hypothetical protein